MNTPFAVLRLEAIDAKERDIWMQAIKKVVSDLRAAIRGYLWRKGGSMFAAWSRKFFIVHEDSITCHENHMSTSSIEYAVKLTEGNVVVAEKEGCVFTISRDGVELLALRAEEAEEMKTWAAAARKSSKRAGDAVVAEVAEEFLLQSALEVRADKVRSAKW